MTYRGTVYRWLQHAPQSLSTARVTRAEFGDRRVTIEWEPPPSADGWIGDGRLNGSLAHHFIQGYEQHPEQQAWQSFQLALHDSPEGVRLLEGSWYVRTPKGEQRGGWVFVLRPEE